jgi:hypothetical protein
MDVHVGSLPAQFEEPVLTSLPAALVDPGADNSLHAVGAEVSLSTALGASSNPLLGLESALYIVSVSTRRSTARQCLRLWDFLCSSLTFR